MKTKHERKKQTMNAVTASNLAEGHQVPVFAMKSDVPKNKVTASHRKAPPGYLRIMPGVPYVNAENF